MRPSGSSSLDALPPREMARKAEEVGWRRRDVGGANTFALAVLAGAFIAMGAIFATTVTAGGAALPYGVSRLLGGLAFSLGLILVVVAGAELFTGNNLIVMAWASRKVSTARLLRNWAIVFAGNFAGAIATAGILFVGKQYTFGKGAVGEQALSIATGKTVSAFVQAIALAAFCNALVCLAIWLTYSARTRRRQDPCDRVADHCLRRLRLRAQRREHVLHPDGALREERLRVCGATSGPGLGASDLGALLHGESAAGDDWERDRRRAMVGAIYWFIYLRNKEEDDVDTGGNQRLRTSRTRGVPGGVRV